MTNLRLVSIAFAGFALFTVASGVVADDKKVGLTSDTLFQPVDYSQSEIKPYVLDGSLNYNKSDGSLSSNMLPFEKTLQEDPFLEQAYIGGLLDTQPMAFSVQDKDKQGQWLVSFDLSPHSTQQQTTFEQSHFNIESAYSFNGTGLPGKSQFYVSYGNRKVPISISFDDAITVSDVNSELNGLSQLNAFDYPRAQLEQDSLQVGFAQQFNDSWAVSISYLKSDLEVVSTEAALQAIEQQQPTSYQFLFDFNQDGRPETVNLLSQLPTFGQLDREFEGIEIKVSRQLTQNLTLGSALNAGSGTIQAEPYVFDANNLSNSMLENFDTASVSLFGDLNINNNWSLDAALKHQNNQYFSIEPNKTEQQVARLDSTTLDIGLQYQTQLSKVGLVIRIDLMNLLGVAHGEGLYDPYQQNLDDRGLAPYTFQTPKYIKLSGSINF